MSYKKLFLILEGNDDERFFQSILIDKLKEIFNDVEIWKYANKTNQKRKNFIDTMNNSEDWDYLCFRDYDMAICITSKKEKITKKFKRISTEKIIIIVKEIESWYLAGINNDFLRKVGAKLMEIDCSSINKETFNNLIPKDMPRIIFIRKILQNYDIDLAMRNSKSFNYLIKNYLNKS